MKKLISLFAALVLLGFVSTASAGPYSYGYNHYYGSGYRYYTPSYYYSYPYYYNYYAPSYTYGYQWYPAAVSDGRSYPAGYYQWTQYGWYRLGYGLEYGAPVVVTTTPIGPYPATAAPCPDTKKLELEIEKLKIQLELLHKQPVQPAQPIPPPAKQ